MSLKVCTIEHMLSNADGMDMARSWFPRVVEERFLESTKDGEIKRAPDPVTMIEGDLTWVNYTDDPQNVVIVVMRAPRTIVATSPSTVVIADAWAWAKGENPIADYPSIMQNTFGGRVQIDRPEAAAKDLLYGRFFLDGDSSQESVNIGTVPPFHTVHLRYLAGVYTPGVWTSPSEFEPRYEAYARWTRLTALASPVVSA